MLNPPSPPPKPIAEVWRPDLVALPQLTFGRRFFRAFFRGFVKLVVLATLRARITGLENFPKHGPAIVASAFRTNHWDIDEIGIVRREIAVILPVAK